MQNQLNYFESNFGSTSTPGGTCDFSNPKDSVVCMGPAAGCGNQGQVVSAKVRSAADVPEEEPITAYTAWERVDLGDGNYTLKATTRKVARAF